MHTLTNVWTCGSFSCHDNSNSQQYQGHLPFFFFSFSGSRSSVIAVQFRMERNYWYFDFDKRFFYIIFTNIMFVGHLPKLWLVTTKHKLFGILNYDTNLKNMKCFRFSTNGCQWAIDDSFHLNMQEVAWSAKLNQRESNMSDTLTMKMSVHQIWRTHKYSTTLELFSFFFFFLKIQKPAVF